MSITYVAQAVIGCDITPLVATYREVRQCEHRASAAPFCAQCGKPMWKQMAVDLNEEYDDKLKRVGMSLATSGYDDRRAFAGIVVAADYRADCAMVAIPSDAREKVRAALEPLGLWDESSFGLWAVQYIS